MHTNGPWRAVETLYSHPHSGRRGVFYHIVDCDGNPLPNDSGLNPDAGDIARLAAAAPELLEALEAMIIGAAACAVHHPGERAVLQEAVNMAIAAKRKAKGTPP